MAINKTTVYDPKGFQDKSTDKAFKNFVVTDDNGNPAKVGNAITALTETMKVSTDAQKEDFRIASRKTDETYSTGQPRVDTILPALLFNNNKSLTLVGVNLFLNNTSTDAKVQTIDSVTRQVIETITVISVHQTLPSRLSFDINRDLYELDKDYYVQVTHYGLTSILNTMATFNLPSSYITPVLNSNFRVLTNRNSDEATRTYDFTATDNMFNIKTKHKTQEDPERKTVINVLSDIELKADKDYIIELSVNMAGAIGEYWEAQEQWFSFMLIDAHYYPITPNYNNSSDGNIMTGGTTEIISGSREPSFDLKGVYRVEGHTNTKNITLVIGKGLYKILFKDRVLVYTLPNTLSGVYKLLTSFVGPTHVIIPGGTYMGNNNLTVEIISFYEK